MLNKTTTCSAFGYTNHCRLEINYRSPQKSDEELIQRLGNRFFHQSFDEIKQVDATEISSNNFYVKSGNDELLLRKVIRFGDQKHQQEIAKLLRHLNLQGIPVPVLHPIHSDNTPFLQDEKGGNWIAYRFIHSDRYVKGNKEEIEQLGDTIAKMHQAFRNFTSEHPNSPLVKEAAKPYLDGYVDVEQMHKLIDTALKVNDEYANCLRNSKSQVIAASHEIAEAAKFEMKPKDGENQILHGDLHPHNMLSGHVITLLDFDTISWGHPYHDIAFALHRLVRQGVFHKTGTIQELRETFLRAYRENSNIHIDPKVLLFSALNRCVKALAWLLQERYLYNRTEWSTDIFKMVSGIEENIAIYQFEPSETCMVH